MPNPLQPFYDTEGRGASRAELEAQDGAIRRDIEDGRLRSPIVTGTQEVLAGGVNHFPNSDISFSLEAATVAGTLPGDAGDTNQEAWRVYWAVKDDPIVLDAAHTLKAVGHSLYAGNEAVNTGVPIWDRVNGWVVMGSAGATQYDLVVQLNRKVAGPGETWFGVFRMLALSNDLLPADFEASMGLWQISGGSEGYARGDAFDLTYLIEGAPGTQAINYRVLAVTDSGFSILSNILNVPDAPDVLSIDNYVKLFYSAGPGFLKFTVYKEVAGVFARVHEVRNSTDLQFNDVGALGIAEAGWPVEPEDRPLAYAQTLNCVVGPFGGAFAQNKLSVLIPGTYDSDATNNDGQFVRVSLLVPTTADRQVALDKFFFGTTFNAWAPDPDIKFADGTVAIPSVSPSSGNPGSGGVFEPPDPGSGGRTCIVKKVGRYPTPVMVKRGRRTLMVPYTRTMFGEYMVGDLAHPYQKLKSKEGTAAEWYLITTKNGVSYPCNPRHRLVLRREPIRYVQAQQVTLGMRLVGRTIRGRWFSSPVVAIELIPKPVAVAAPILRDPLGEVPDGKGTFIAGFSPQKDRGLLSSNVKPDEFLL